MKKILLILTAVFFTAGIAANGALADTKEETTLEKDISAIDKDASTPAGEKAVVQRLKDNFKLDAAAIDQLRQAKLGFGEIAILSALANASGKSTGDLLALRKGPPVKGWGLIAKSLGLNLGLVISKAERVKSEADKNIKGMTEKAANAQGKTEKIDHTEKMDHKDMMIERPEMPERHGR